MSDGKGFFTLFLITHYGLRITNKKKEVSLWEALSSGVKKR
jgi:hypothetical protein